MADAIDTSDMPDPTTIGLSPSAQADPTADMPTPAQLYKAHHGYEADGPEEVAEFMRNPDATEDVRKAKSGWYGLSMLSGLPSIAAQANPITPVVAATVGGLNALPASVGAVLQGTIGNDPEDAARLGAIARDKLRSGAASVYNLANYLPSKIITKPGQDYADSVLGLPVTAAKQAAPYISSVIGEAATTSLGEWAEGATTLLPAAGAKGLALRGVDLAKTGAGAAARALKPSVAPEGTTYDQGGTAVAPSTTIKPDVDAPVTGDSLRAQPNPIPAPEGTVHRTLTEEGKSPAAPENAVAAQAKPPAPTFESPDAEPTAPPPAPTERPPASTRSAGPTLKNSGETSTVTAGGREFTLVKRPDATYIKETGGKTYKLDPGEDVGAHNVLSMVDEAPPKPPTAPPPAPTEIAAPEPPPSAAPEGAPPETGDATQSAGGLSMILTRPDGTVVHGTASRGPTAAAGDAALSRGAEPTAVLAVSRAVRAGEITADEGNARLAKMGAAQTPAPGNPERGSAQLFSEPTKTGPQAAPQPEQQGARAQSLDEIDKLSGGMLPSRRASAISGDYNATGDDYQLKEVGSEPMRQQLASENSALHAAAENVHASVGSQFSNSVDAQALSDRGRVTRGAIQGIQDWFEKATDNAYDAARAAHGDQPMPTFLARAGGFLRDDANYMPEGFRRAAQTRLEQLRTAGDKGADGSTPAAPSSVAAAEKFREWLNANRTLDNMHAVKQLVTHTDMDVAEHSGPTLFQAARDARRHQYQMLEEPVGIRKLLTPADSQGINHAIPEHKVMDYIADLPREQHEHVLNVLRAGAHLGGGELAEQSAAAIREIQAHMVSRMHDAATNADGTWNARKFYNQASSYAPKLGDTFRDQPKTLRNLQTINKAGNTLSMDKHYPGAAAQAERTGLGTKVLQGVGGVASSLAHEIPMAGRLIGRGIEGAVEGMSEKSREAARDKVAMSRLVDRNGKQRGSVQLFNDNKLNRENEERTTFHGKDIRNPRTEYNANSQLAGGRQRLSAEQDDIISRLGGGQPLGARVGGGKQRGAVGDLSQRDAVEHKGVPHADEGATVHRYTVPGNGGTMNAVERPGLGVTQGKNINIVDKGKGWGTRTLQRAVDDTHARGQVWHSDDRVSEGHVGSYKNLAALGYDVKLMPHDKVQGEYKAVGDHVFEVRPGKGQEYQAPKELEDFIRKSAPPHKIDPNGPSTWEELQARRHEPVMPINPQGGEGSIYKDVPTNMAFRAWHDKTHLDVNGGFDHDGELKTAHEQLRQAQEAGLSEESQKALWADTWETFKHHEDTGEFPKNPRAFVAQRMRDPTPLGQRVAASKQRGSVRVTNEAPLEGAPENDNVPGDEVVKHVMRVHYPEEKTLATKDPKQRERDVRELLGPDANGNYRHVEYPLDRIHNDTPISSDVIDRYAKLDTPYPAIVMNKAGEVRDGNHRIEAARKRGDETIPAYVPIGHRIPGETLGSKMPSSQRGSVKVMDDEEPWRSEEYGSTLNIGLHQGKPGEKGFRKMSKQEAQAAVESTGAKVTKNTVLTPEKHGVAEPTAVISTDRPISDYEMQDVLAKTKQSAIPQRTGQGDESMHVAPGHEETAKEQGWDTFNRDYFREHDGRTATETEANPSAPNPYPPHPGATVKGAKQSAFPGIYDDPKEIMQRLGEGKPESPHLKEIFGKTRKDLHDDAIARGDVEPKTPIPGIAPKGRGSAHADNVKTPENAERIRSIIQAYKEHDPSGYHGMVGWYEMDPMYQSIKEILGGSQEAADRVYHTLNSMTSYASPMSPVVTEIKRGTAAAMMAAEGNFDKFAKYGNLPQKKAPAALKAKNFELGNEGTMAHGSQAPAMGRFLETGQEANAVKTGTYRRSGDAPSRTGSDYQNTQPVGDSHWSRGVGLADVRGAKAFEGSADGPEMKTLGKWFHDEVARHPDIDLPSTSAQAVQWGALSKETGVDSPIGAPKLEIWADMIADAAKREGVAPKAMWERIVKRLAK